MGLLCALSPTIEDVARSPSLLHWGEKGVAFDSHGVGGQPLSAVLLHVLGQAAAPSPTPLQALPL